jgi:hypothetical protein
MSTADPAQAADGDGAKHACCVQLNLDVGTPGGHEVNIGGVATYAAGPALGAAGGKALVLAVDVFGWSLVNIRLLADKYAERMGAWYRRLRCMKGHAPPYLLLRG